MDATVIYTPTQGDRSSTKDSPMQYSGTSNLIEYDSDGKNFDVFDESSGEHHFGIKEQQSGQDDDNFAKSFRRSMEVDMRKQKSLRVTHSQMRMTSKAFSFITCIAVFPVAHGCGLVPGGQERTLSFNIRNFKIPAAMVHSDHSTASLVPTISANENEARRFVQNLIRRSIEDVLYRQGRGAGLTDDVISLILQQLMVEIKYNPLKCDTVFTHPMGMNNMAVDMKTNCQIIDGTVTYICRKNNRECMMTVNFEPVPPEYYVISGTLKTTNIIMANWSREMWQSVFNRVTRALASEPYASYFQAASVTFT